MNSELSLYMQKFKEISLNLIRIIENEDYDALGDKISARQSIIDSISSLSFTKDEISKIASELEIIPLNGKITALIMEKKITVKNILHKNAANHNVSSNYIKSLNNKFNFLSKKV